MATAILLRSLRHRGLPTPLFSTYKCLTGNAKMPWATFRLGKTMEIFARPFSSKPVGNHIEEKNVEGIEDFVGSSPAKSQTLSYPTNTVAPKKHFDEPQTKKKKNWHEYKIIEAPNGKAWVEAAGLLYTFNEIGPLIFRQYKEFMESCLRKPIFRTVVIIPAYFSDAQQEVTKNAATVADLDVHRVIVNGPTADLFPYGLRLNDEDDHIGVFDISGGNLIVKALQIPDPGLAVRLPREYKIIEAPNGNAWVEVAGLLYTFNEIGPLIFRRYKEFVESCLRKPIFRTAVIVPAYFSDAQQEVTKNAATIAGLDVRRIIVNGPTADLFPYGLCLNGKEDHIGVFDISGGNFVVEAFQFLNPGVAEKETNVDNQLEILVDKIKTVGGVAIYVGSSKAPGNSGISGEITCFQV